MLLIINRFSKGIYFPNAFFWCISVCVFQLFLAYLLGNRKKLGNNAIPNLCDRHLFNGLLRCLYARYAHG